MSGMWEQPEKQQCRLTGAELRPRRKAEPTRTRQLGYMPGTEVINKVLADYAGIDSPALLVKTLISRKGFQSFEAYDTACLRAERWMRKNRTQRVPRHIRDKIILKLVVEKCIDQKFRPQVASE